MMRVVMPALLVALCLLAACSSSRETRDEPRAEIPRADTLPPRTPPVEEPPEEETPPRPYTAQGFRIQILTTGEKDAADNQVEDAVAWWNALPSARRPDGLGRGALSVDVRWKQPYYRVRIGDFASRADAQQVLATVRQQFPDAFIVPDTVTLWR